MKSGVRVLIWQVEVAFPVSSWSFRTSGEIGGGASWEFVESGGSDGGVKGNPRAPK